MIWVEHFTQSSTPNILVNTQQRVGMKRFVFTKNQSEKLTVVSFLPLPLDLLSVLGMNWFSPKPPAILIYFQVSLFRINLK